MGAGDLVAVRAGVRTGGVDPLPPTPLHPPSVCAQRSGCDQLLHPPCVVQSSEKGGGVLFQSATL